jgi:hypothetical protein
MSRDSTAVRAVIFGTNSEFEVVAELTMLISWVYLKSDTSLIVFTVNSGFYSY